MSVEIMRRIFQSPRGAECRLPRRLTCRPSGALRGVRRFAADIPPLRGFASFLWPHPIQCLREKEIELSSFILSLNLIPINRRHFPFFIGFVSRLRLGCPFLFGVFVNFLETVQNCFHQSYSFNGCQCRRPLRQLICHFHVVFSHPFKFFTGLQDFQDS